MVTSSYKQILFNLLLKYSYFIIVKFFIKKKVDPNIQKRIYNNIFQIALYRGYKVILNLLFKNSINFIQNKNIYSQIPLYLTIYSSYISTFQFLVNLGLNLSTLDIKGNSIF